MAWLVGAAAIAAVIYFLVVSRGFRLFVVALFVLAGAGIYLLVENGNREQRARQQEYAENQRWEATAITSDEISLSDVSLTKESQGWYLKGTLANNSNANLGDLQFTVTIRD